MKIKGIVKAVSTEFPHTVLMTNGETFKSDFTFRSGDKINLEFTGDTFTYPWPQGFVHCSPNGLSSYILSQSRVEAAKNPNTAFFEHGLSWHLKKAVCGKKQSWVVVESFYTYHYSAEFDPKTNILTTNWPISLR